MKFRTLIATGVVAFTCMPLMHGWGQEGHKSVGELARMKLTPATRAWITKLLGNDDLADVAVWADDVRSAGRHSGPLVDDSEALAFNKKFPNNKNWHFVDLPLGTKAYSLSGKFSSKDDIVHAINRCIEVLEDRSGEFTKSQAVRLLVHFVGDLHQPMHASTGYYNLSNPSAPKLVTDPSAVDVNTGDRGGNSLHMGKSDELHALWDSDLVRKFGGGDYKKLADKLAGKSPASLTPGDYHHWAETWATESVGVAANAYRGIIFGRAELNKRHQLDQMDIKLPPNYAKMNQQVAGSQLAKAGFRLAELLNRIQTK